MPLTPRTGEAWSEHEVPLIVADYFEMLEAEILDQPLVKAEHSRALIPQLDGRSKQSRILPILPRCAKVTVLCDTVSHVIPSGGPYRWRWRGAERISRHSSEHEPSERTMP